MVSVELWVQLRKCRPDRPPDGFGAGGAQRGHMAAAFEPPRGDVSYPGFVSGLRGELYLGLSSFVDQECLEPDLGFLVVPTA